MRKLLPGLVCCWLTACGGGGSSGSGGGGGTGPTTGTFTGTYSITISSGGDQVANSGPITMVVNTDGSVIRDPGGDGSSGTLSGNSFTIDRSASVLLNEPGLSCVGTITQTGTVNPGTVTGNFSSSNLNCNGVNFTVQGTFTTAFASAAAGPFVVNPILLAVRDPAGAPDRRGRGDQSDA